MTHDDSGGIHSFEVTETGLVTCATAKEPFFDGLNTSQLTIVGYSVTIDATDLSGSFSISGIGSFSAAAVHTVTTFPGTEEFNSTDVPLFNFELWEEDGLLDYDTPPDGILSGRNTTDLVVRSEGGGT